MKVLVLTDYISPDIPGGAWEFAYKFSLYASLNVPTKIVCFRTDSKQPSSHHESSSLEIIRVNEKIGRVHELLSIDHDIAFIHSPRMFLNYLLSFRNKSKPIVSMIHSPSSVERALNYEKKGIRSLILGFVDSFLMRRAEGLFFASEYMKDLATKKKALLENKSMVLPLGIDPPIFLNELSEKDNRIAVRVEKERQSGYKILFCIRRLVPRMGISNLVKAVESLKDVRLYIAGNGPLKEQIESEIRNTGLCGRVFLLGRISDDLKAFMFRNSYLSIVPTTRLEGFGISMLESMAHGCPPVVTPIGGMYEFIKANGLEPLVSFSASVDDLKERIEYFVHNDFERDKISQRCKLMASSYYYETISEVYLRTISFIVEKSQRRKTK